MDDDIRTPDGPVSDRMQALLSRAVDEQVHEQRAVSTVLAELRGQVAGLVSSVSAVPSASDIARLEGVVNAVVSDLRTATTLLGQRLDVLAERVDQPGKDSGAPTSDTTATLSELATRLSEVAERLSDVGDAAGGMPALATELHRVREQVQSLTGLQDQLAAVGSGVQHLQDDPASRTIALGLAGLREDVGGLTERVAGTASPTADEVAALVSERVTDRLVEMLAPRVAELVLSRVGEALASQLTGVLSTQVRRDTAEVVQVVTADSERRVVAHVDEAVLALAEALLRRRGAGRPPSVVPPPADAPPDVSQSSADSDDETLLPDDDDVAGNAPLSGAEAEPDAGPAPDAGPHADDGVLDVDEDGQPVQAVMAASERPAVPREPVLEPTPDFDDDDVEPVTGVPGPRPVPLALQPTLSAGKRRPWWRPGG